MKNIYILNGAREDENSKGQLNRYLSQLSADYFESQNFEIELHHVFEGYDSEQEIEKHLWADCIIVHFPLHWMNVPWILKRYFDEVYSDGMDGRLAYSDGRRSHAPTKNYGMGGTLTDTKYMFVVTLNAPNNAFNNISEPFFSGESLDDVLRPVHYIYKFMGLKPLKTFALYDVFKNPTIEQDVMNYQKHLGDIFGRH